MQRRAAFFLKANAVEVGEATSNRRVNRLKKRESGTKWCSMLRVLRCSRADRACSMPGSNGIGLSVDKPKNRVLKCPLEGGA